MVKIKNAYYTINYGINETNRRTVKDPTSLSADVPIAEVGQVIPYIIGRRRVSRPNIIWYGNIQAIYEDRTEVTTSTRIVPGFWDNGIYMEPKELEETITTTTTVPVGFTSDMAFGICLGPNVVLRAIYVDEEEVWSGSVGPNRAQIDFVYSERDVTAYFHGGNFDQPAEPLIPEADFPAHVGTAWIYIPGLRTDNRLGALSFEVERFVDPLVAGFTFRNRYLDDINTATAIYDVFTNEWGGAGISEDDVDIPSFRIAATVLGPYNGTETNYASVLIDQETAVSSVIGSLNRQAYSAVYQNPSTGKIEIKVIRVTNVDYGNATKFGYGTLLSLSDFNKSSWADTVSALRGIYVERDNNYEPTPVFVQNLTNITDVLGTRRSEEVQLPFVTKANLCMDVVARELSLNTVPTFEATVLTTRYGADLLPGQVALLDYPLYEFWGVPVIVNRVRKSSLEANTVTVSVEQYILPSPDPVFDLPATPFDPGASYDPLPPTFSAFYTAPFWIAEKAGLVTANTSNNVVYPIVLPEIRSELQLKFLAAINNMPSRGRVEVISEGVYPTDGELSVAIDRYDGIANGQLASIVIDGVSNPVHLINQTLDQARAGASLVFINNEIFVFTGASVTGPGQWTLTGVRRAVIDTAPQSHAQGSRVFVTRNYTNNIVRTAFNYPLGFAPSWKFRSATTNQITAKKDETTIAGWSPTRGRTVAPPRPHDTKIAGQRTSARMTLTEGEEYTITWKTRARSSGTIKFQTDAAENAEAITSTTAQYHRVYIRDAGNVLRMIGQTNNNATYNTLNVTIPSNINAGAGSLFVRSVNQFGESVYDDELPVTVFKGSDATFRYALEE